RLALDLFECSDIRHRLIRIDIVYRSNDRALERRRVERGTNHDTNARRGTLLDRDVCAWSLRSVQGASPLIRNDADHLPGDFRSKLRFARCDLLNQNPLADRVLTGEIASFHRLIDDDCRRSPFDVSFAEPAALDDAHPQSLEVAWADHLDSARG